jgi:hypothetical protein
MTTQELFMAILGAVAGFGIALMLSMFNGVNWQEVLLGSRDKSTQSSEKQPAKTSFTRTLVKGHIVLMLLNMVAIIAFAVLALGDYGGTGYNQPLNIIFAAVPGIVVFLLTRQVLQRNRNRQTSHPANQPH